MGTRLLRWAWMPVIALLVALAIVLRPDGGSAPAGAQTENAMAIDADPNDPDIDDSADRLLGQQFLVSVDITSVGTPYWGYDLVITYAPTNLSFIPTSDLSQETTPESWDYTDLGGMAVQGIVSETPDWPAPGTNRLVGGATRETVTTTTATGQAVLATFQCVAAGTSTLHLVALAESHPYTTTLSVADEPMPMPTTLADATITCAEATATPTVTQVGVGGIAELPALAGASAEEAGAQGDGSGWSVGRYAALAGGLAAAAVLLAAAGMWYARRRWLR